MYITVSLFMIIAVAVIAAMAGFWLGRSLRWKMEEYEEDETEGRQENQAKGQNAGRDLEQGMVMEVAQLTEPVLVRRKVEDAEVFRPEQRWNKNAYAAIASIARGGAQTGMNLESREAFGEDFPGGHRAKNSLERRGAHQSQRRQKGGERMIPTGKAIGSPCSGEVNFFYEGSRRGALIEPVQGMVYAPVSGKITRLYPMGNAFLLRTDFGVELLIKVGNKRDEMLSMYFRPRIVQNEIVNKGKLLLEFDLEGLQAEGEDTSVSVSVEAADDYRDIMITGKNRVRVGEELLWVKDRKVFDSKN